MSLKAMCVALFRLLFVSVILKTEVSPAMMDAGENALVALGLVMTLFVSLAELVSPRKIALAVFLMVPAEASAFTVAPIVNVMLLSVGMVGSRIPPPCMVGIS